MSNTHSIASASCLADHCGRLTVARNLIDLLLSSSLLVGDGIHEPHDAAPGALELLTFIRDEIEGIESYLSEIGQEQEISTTLA